MAMTPDEIFRAALSMIQVTPENYKALTAEMIAYLCETVVGAEKMMEKLSVYEGLTEKQIKDRIAP